MFGKIYEQTFTGSMCGKGPVVFSVWAYIIAKTKADHIVEVNPRIVATAIGCAEKDVAAALKLFCAADKDSRNPDYKGRRLIPAGDPYSYFVTGHGRFRSYRNQDERREYMRAYMNKRRKTLRYAQHDGK